MTDAAIEWCYELDRNDRLTAVSGEWDRFALENGAPAAVAGAVLGRPLWDFVDGVETVHLLRRIVGGVRASGRAGEVPFRCDGPGLERHMLFRAEPLDGGGVRITTRLMDEIPLPAGPRAPAEPPPELVQMCSWCNRIKVDGGAWVELSAAVARLGLFTAATPPPITHGMCAECLAAMEPLLADAPAAGRAG